MKINAKATVMVVFVAGLSLTTGTAAGADEPTCSTPWLTSVAAHLADPGRWSYTYQVSFCVENGKVTRIKPHLTHEEDGTTCVWVTNAEESDIAVANGAREAFNMGELSCEDANGKPGTVNPWSIITVRPDGTSTVTRKGVGDVIYE